VTKILGFVGKHWPLLLAFLAGGAADHFLLRPAQPTVHEVATSTAKADEKGTLDSKTSAGAEKITITEYAQDVGGWAPPVLPLGTSSFQSTKGEVAVREPGMPNDFCRPVVVPGEDRILRQTVIERGPSTTESHATNEAHQEQAQSLDLTISPASRLELQLGLEDVFGLSVRNSRAAARVRLFGNLWGELSAMPLRRCPDGRWCPALGLAGALSF
jgi:hypothetical protein